MMNSVKYWRYIKYCILILCYGFSIIVYSSPSAISISSEILMTIQLKEIFHDLFKVVVFSVATNMVLAILAIGILLTIKFVINKFNYYQRVCVYSNELNKTKLHSLKDNLDGFNPFLYSCKTIGLLE